MKVIKNYLYNLSYQILSIILPLITVPYISGVLGEAGVGKYAYTFANTQYFIIFGMVGITLYANRQIAYVREDKRKLKDTFYSIFVLQLITTGISCILFLIFSLVINTGEDRIIYLAQGLNLLAAMVDISWLFMGLEQFKKTVVRNTIVRLISLASIFIFIKDSSDIINYVLIVGLSAFIGNLTFWMYVPKEIGFKDIKICDLSIHFKSSLALFVPQIAIQVYLLLDRTLLGLITDIEQVGYYENSQKLVKIGLTLATAVGTVMMPKIANTISKGDMDKVKSYIKASFIFVSGISFAVAFGLIGITNELVPWFFKGRFDGIESLINISTLIIIAIGWSNVMGMQLLVPMKKNREFTISVTAGALVNFVLNLLLLKYLRGFGACLTTVLAETTVTLIQFYYVREIVNIKELLKSILIFIPSGAIMFILVRCIGIWMGAGIITNLVQVVIGGVIYILIISILIKAVYKVRPLEYIKSLIK